MTRAAAASLAVLLVVGLSGCGGDDAAVQARPTASPAVGAAAAVSPVAELQTGLTELLVERVHVAAAVTRAAAAGDAEPELTALDGISVALADVIGATYSAAREPLLEALRTSDRLLGAHAAELAGGGGRDERAALRAAQGEVAQVLRRVVPALDEEEVARRLGADLDAQLSAGSYDGLRAAGRDAAETARLLTAAIAADRGLGPSTGEAVRWRADASGLLTEHVALMAALATELRDPGPGSVSARDALDANAAELAALLGERYPTLAGSFARTWTAHLDRLETYATARAAGRPAEAGLLHGLPAELARLLAEHVRGLPAQSAQAELEPALLAQLTAVDAAAQGLPTAAATLREAVAAALPAAALVSAAAAEDLSLT